MKIVSLVENTTKTDMKVKHGLSLYIETENHKILFDAGQNSILLPNAEKKNIDLSQVDTFILSHGHRDHGGGIKYFLKVNSRAKLYIQRKAFEPYFTKAGFLKVPIGIDKSLMNNPRTVLLDGDFRIDEELLLFTVKDNSLCASPMNDSLLDRNGRDSFAHEQNLVITEKGKSYLVMGCGHNGVVNIMKAAEKYEPLICVGGYHLTNPVNGKRVSDELLDSIASALNSYKNTDFYTCHCTGMGAYEYLAERVPRLYYLSCGDEIEY